MLVRRLSLLAALTLAGCGHAPRDAPKPPPHEEPHNTSNNPPHSQRPDAATLNALLASLDPSCSDTCCVPHVEWIGDRGPAMDTKIADAARSAITTASSARDLALTLRVVSRATDERDIPRLVGFLRDTRDAGLLPLVFTSEARPSCKRVRFEPTSPSAEALRGINRIWELNLPSTADYDTWAAANPDPESSFDVWSARLAHASDKAATLRALRSRSGLLLTRIVLAECDGDGRCGASDGELEEAMRAHLGRATILDWLEGRGRPPEWPRSGVRTLTNLLRLSSGVLTREDVPRIEAMWRSQSFARSVYHGWLTVLLARLAPNERTRVFDTVLADDGAFAVSIDGIGVVLREGARRDPVGLSKHLTAWFFRSPSRDEESADTVETATSILRGLAEADVATAGPVFARLLTRPFVSRYPHVIHSLTLAARHFGCANLPDNLESAEDRERAVVRVRACATALAPSR